MRRYFFILGLLLLVSCTQIEPIESKQFPKKLVLISFFSPQHIFTVHVSKVIGLDEYPHNSDTIVWVDNALCSLYVNDRFLQVLQDTGSGCYVSPNGYRPEVGKHYKIKVFAPGFPSIEASSYVPDSIHIISVYKKDSALVIPDDFNVDYIPLVKVKVENKLDSVQYVEFFLTEYLPDEGYYAVGLRDLGPILSQGVLNQFYVLLSSDKIPLGKSVLSCYYLPFYYGINSEVYIPKNLQVHLRVVSEQYYNYKLTASVENNYDDFWGGTYQPVSVYSNVKGGYGIFAGYNESIDSTTYPVSLDSILFKTEAL